MILFRKKTMNTNLINTAEIVKSPVYEDLSIGELKRLQRTLIEQIKQQKSINEEKRKKQAEEAQRPDLVNVIIALQKELDQLIINPLTPESTTDKTE